MDHIAIDLGSQESQVCVRGPDGTILGASRSRPQPTDAPERRAPSLRICRLYSAVGVVPRSVEI